MKVDKGIAIIDYKMSNLFSIKNALDNLNIKAFITSDPEEILNSKGAILPGVGSYPEAMSNLANLNLISTIKEFADSGKPFMGICLGLQLLFENSEEFDAPESIISPGHHDPEAGCFVCLRKNDG